MVHLAPPHATARRFVLPPRASLSGRAAVAGSAGWTPPLQFARLKAALLAFTLLAAILPKPAWAANCGMGNKCPTVSALSVATTPVPASATVAVACSGTDPDGTVTKFVLTATSGQFANGLTTIDVPVAPPQASASVSANWTAPSSGGTVTLTCTAWDNGGLMGKPTAGDPASLDVAVASGAPPVVTVAPAAAAVFPNESVAVSVSATSPQGKTVQIVLAASVGVVTQPDASGKALWTAPNTAGTAVLTATATDSDGLSSTATAQVQVVLSKAAGFLASGASGTHPTRIAADGTGGLWVTDPRARTLVHVGGGGALLSTWSIDGIPTSVAVAISGDLYVGDTEHGRVLVLGAAGTSKGLLGEAGTFLAPQDIAVDPQSGTVLVADAKAAVVRRFDALGTELAPLTASGGAPTGVAVANGQTAIYVADSALGLVRVYDKAGTQVATIGSFGAKPGNLTRPAGVALAKDGRIFVVDSYQSSVSVFLADGTYQGSMGSWGQGAGQLNLPAGAVLDSFGRLLVTSAENGRIEVFTLPGATTLVCAGDSDCDGMPDTWEVANGLNPKDPSDAFTDLDGDGLSNLGEYQKGTLAKVADTDGDGVSDGVEVSKGLNPLDMQDNVPKPVAQLIAKSEPTKVWLIGSASSDPNLDPLTYAWSVQASPSPVAIADPVAMNTWTVLRSAGDHVFGLTVSDGKISQGPTSATVAVQNVAPTADAGPELSAAVGAAVTLDARFSRDANGSPLAYTWKQTSGASAALTAGETASPSFVPSQAGVYTFELVANDGSQPSAPVQTSVVVGDVGNTVPVAAIVAPEVGQVGQSVLLDGGTSRDLEVANLTYSWKQVAGAPVALAAAGPKAVTFTPVQAGRYEFQLVVNDGTWDSPAARATILVDSDTSGPARAVLTPHLAANTAETVALDGSASYVPDGSQPTCTWKQIEGVHVPMAENADCKTSFVPIDPGTYVFELQTASALGAGASARATITVDDPLGNAVPLAKVADLDSTIAAGETTQFDGTPSWDPDGKSVNYTWTQISGPRLTLSDPHAAVLSVTPPLAGLYMFELRVDDGELRSAPLQVGMYATGTSGSDAGNADAVAGDTSDADSAGDSEAPDADASGSDASTAEIGGDAQAPADSQATSDAQTGNDSATGQDSEAADVGLDSQADALQTDADSKSTPKPGVSAAPPSDSGCSAQTRGSAGMPALLILAILAVVLLRRRLPAWLLPAVAVTLVLPPLARASDPPHNAANLVNVCEDCHVGHNTLGANLTSNASNQNLCLNCHSLKGLNWSSSDQAVPGVSGTSHRWDSALNNAAFGASAPTDPTVAKHLGTGGTTLLCSGCHDQHSQTKTPADPFAPAAAGSQGRHFLRMDTVSGQLCVACHTVRNVQDATTYTGNKLSHPVSVVIPTSPLFAATPVDTDGTAQMDAKSGTATAGTTTSLTNTAGAFTGLAGKWVRFTSGANKNTTRLIATATATQITWAAALPSAIAVGVTYRIDNDGNTTNNLVLDNAGSASYTTGKVACLTCHAVHYADSNSATHDGAPGGAGDGNLLRRTNDDTACTGCHKVKLHNSSTTSTQYGTWGATFTCRTCHDTHDSKNIYLLRESITTPNSGVKAVDFRSLTGKADFSFAGVTTPGNGVCEVCHTMTKNSDGSARFRNSGGSDGGQHYAGNCVGCHSHADGFKPGESGGNTDCVSCHPYGIDVAATSRTTTYHHVVETGANLTGGITTYTTSATPTLATTDKDKACVQCHADHNVFRPDLNTSNTLGRGANLRSRIASGPPAGNPPANSAPGDTTPGFYTNREYDAAFASKGLCLNCHVNVQNKSSADQLADGTTVTPAINAANYAASRHTFTVAGQFTNGNSAFTVDCVKCHNDGSTTAQQNGTNRFALHASADRSLRAPLGQTAPHDAAEEDFCFRCHHKTTDTTPGGGPAKTTTLKDYYNVATMSSAAESVYGQFQYGRTTTTVSSTNQLYFKPLAAEAAAEPMPAAQSTDAVVSTVSSNTLYLRSATDGPAPSGTMPTAFQLASGTYAGTTTLQQRSMMPTAGTTQETITQTTNTSSRYYHLAQFLSPPIATAATIAAGASLTLNVRVQESSANMNLFARYALYRWTAANALGTTLEPVAQYATEAPTTAGNWAIAFTTNTAATFAVGDKLFLEVEYYTNAPTAGGTASFFFGNATSNASLVLPAALSFTTTTGGPIGGTWVARSMSAGTTAVANETQSATAETVPTGTSKWRRVTFVSPAVSATTAVAAGNWTITVNAYNSSANAKARVRYRLATWKSTDVEGTIVKDWTSDTQTWGTTSPGTPLTITFAGGAATLTSGDALILDMEIETNTVATGGSYVLGYVFGATAAGNLLMPTTLSFSKTTSAAGYSHGVYTYNGRHRANTTDENLAYIAANKHVECEDCHNPHAATAGIHALKTNAVSGTLTGVSGAVATWATTTNWSTASSYALGTATKEYEICFKCHSGANTNLATWNANWTDVARDFSPKNRSIHPVTVALNDASRTNALTAKALTAAAMTAAWSSVGTQTMYCSDCHGEGVTTPAAQGPHGSAVAFLLKGTNTLWPANATGTLYTIGSNTGVFCRNCHTMTNSNNTVHNTGNHSSVACIRCHVLVPHGSGMSRLIGDSDSANMPARMAYQGNKANMWIAAFTKGTTPTSGYSTSNCAATATSGCSGDHPAGAQTENW